MNNILRQFEEKKNLLNYWQLYYFMNRIVSYICYLILYVRALIITIKLRNNQ